MRSTPTRRRSRLDRRQQRLRTIRLASGEETSAVGRRRLRAGDDARCVRVRSVRCRRLSALSVPRVSRDDGAADVRGAVAASLERYVHHIAAAAAAAAAAADDADDLDDDGACY